MILAYAFNDFFSIFPFILHVYMYNQACEYMVF